MRTLKKWQIVSLVAALAAIIGGIFSPVALVQAWHFSVLACLMPAMGCLFLLLLFQATGGKWIDGIRPALMVGRGLVFWCFLAMIPMLIFQPAVYHWLPEEIGSRAVFLNRPFFTIRFVVYLLFFSGLSLLVERGKQLGAGGLIAFALVAYFLAIDAVMAINPAWYSSGFPVVFMSACVLSDLALALCFQVPASDHMVWRDAGNLLLASVIFWSYVSFLQFLIIWAGNLPNETGWYVVRGAGGWKWVTIFLAICNFFGPFFHFALAGGEGKTGLAAGGGGVGAFFAGRLPLLVGDAVISGARTGRGALAGSADAHRGGRNFSRGFQQDFQTKKGA